MVAEAEGRIESPGRRALCAILDIVTQEELAAETGLGRSCIGNLAAGLNLPSAETRIALLEHRGIPLTAWRPDPVAAHTLAA